MTGAAVRSVGRGIHTGQLLGVPATGNQVEFRATDIHRLENGRIAQTWHLEDYFGFGNVWTLAVRLGMTAAPRIGVLTGPVRP